MRAVEAQVLNKLITEIKTRELGNLAEVRQMANELGLFKMCGNERVRLEIAWCHITEGVSYPAKPEMTCVIFLLWMYGWQLFRLTGRAFDIAG